MGQKMVKCKKYFLVKLNDTWVPKSEHARAGVLMNAFLLSVVRGWIAEVNLGLFLINTSTFDPTSTVESGIAKPSKNLPTKHEAAP